LPLLGGEALLAVPCVAVDVVFGLGLDLLVLGTGWRVALLGPLGAMRLTECRAIVLVSSVYTTGRGVVLCISTQRIE
jgi:hypothetical protein